MADCGFLAKFRRFWAICGLELSRCRAKFGRIAGHMRLVEVAPNLGTNLARLRAKCEPQRVGPVFRPKIRGPGSAKSARDFDTGVGRTGANIGLHCETSHGPREFCRPQRCSSGPDLCEADSVGTRGRFGTQSSARPCRLVRRFHLRRRWPCKGRRRQRSTSCLRVAEKPGKLRSCLEAAPKCPEVTPVAPMWQNSANVDRRWSNVGHHCPEVAEIRQLSVNIGGVWQTLGQLSPKLVQRWRTNHRFPPPRRMWSNFGQGWSNLAEKWPSWGNSCLNVVQNWTNGGQHWPKVDQARLRVERVQMSTMPGQVWQTIDQHRSKLTELGLQLL